MFVVQNKDGRKLIVYANTAQDAIDHVMVQWGGQGWFVRS